MRNEQWLCAAWMGLAAALFADLVARGTGSLYGRFFLWLVYHVQ